MGSELTPGEIRDAVQYLESACTQARSAADTVTEKLTGHIDYLTGELAQRDKTIADLTEELDAAYNLITELKAESDYAGEDE